MARTKTPGNGRAYVQAVAGNTLEQLAEGNTTAGTDDTGTRGFLISNITADIGGTAANVYLDTTVGGTASTVTSANVTDHSAFLWKATKDLSISLEPGERLYVYVGLAATQSFNVLPVGR